MKKLMNIALPVLMASTLSIAAYAQEPVPAPAVPDSATQKRDQVIEKREQNQEKRIENGMKSGQLTPEEAKKLQVKEDKIKGMEKKAEADGKITKKEMNKIEKAQDNASNEIYKKKHNRRKAK